MTDLTITANRIAANAGVNGYPARNAIVIEEAKQRIRYKNGVTKMPYSAMALLNDSERDVRHSDTLARNIRMPPASRSRPAPPLTTSSRRASRWPRVHA
jgi:hypothetical protein